MQEAKESITDKKEQARKELDEIMRHAEMLKAIIDEPEPDPRIMSGKYDVTNSFTAPGLAEWIITEAELD